MRQSMTGFASATGVGHGVRWSWEVRCVNARGLDVRIRVPDWIEGLEAGLRAAVTKAVTRGNMTVALRVSGGGADDPTAQVRLNAAQMAVVLDGLVAIEAEAAQRGIHLAPSTGAAILAQRGVLDVAGDSTDVPALRVALLAQFDTVLAQCVRMRQSEGAALADVLARQVAGIDDLVWQAEAEVALRRDAQAAKLDQALARVVHAMGTEAPVDPARIAQELALIAVKSDVTEELDRLRAHVAAAGDLLRDPAPVGRRLDFLMQEFNREANTLCAKSQSSSLTAIGLELKILIEQMREQVQNVE